MAAGAWLGGQRSALLMQSSGVGNCINMLSLIRACRFPMLMLVTMRGEWEEFNPWQVPMGSIVEPTLEALRHPRRQGRDARSGGAGGAERAAACVRRRPRRRGAAVAEADRPQGVGEMMFERRAAMATLARQSPEESVRRAGARLLHLGCLRRRRRRPQLLSLGRDGRRRDDRARPCAGQAERARRRHHRRRRDADGAWAASPPSACRSRTTSPSWCSTTASTARPACRRATPAAASICSRWRAAAASSA